MTGEGRTPANDSGGAVQRRRLEQLVTHPHEALEVELKGWLDLESRVAQADLAKALIALANTGGGYVVIGFSDAGGVVAEAAERPATLEQYTQDRVAGVIDRYAEPPFSCAVHHVTTPSGGAFPVIVISGDHRVPIRSKRDGPEGRHLKEHTYYIRRPGPKSEPPQSAREWDELLGRCIRASRADLLDAIRGIITGADAPAQPARSDALEEWVAESLERWDDVRERLEPVSAERVGHGWYSVAYLLEGDFAELTPPAFLDVLRVTRGTETGWPVWIVMDGEGGPSLRGNVIEHVIEGGSVFPGDVDFWRADSSGRMFLVRGFDEDGSHSKRDPGMSIDFVLPIWRIGEALLHPARLAERLGDPDAAVTFEARWHGIRGRHLVAGERRSLFRARGPAQENEVLSRVEVRAASRIPDELPELTHQLIAPLYWQFNFFELDSRVVAEEILEMRRGR